jgi:hypothetical protein
MLEDLQVYNGDTRTWFIFDDRAAIAAAVKDTYWEPQAVGAWHYYQTFEGHIYRVVLLPMQEIIPIKRVM